MILILPIEKKNPIIFFLKFMMREIGMSIPQYFTCPISLELLSDPVTLCTGQTYDRPCIEKWLSAGNFTCPVTMQKLHDLSLIPNHTLKHLIDQWVLMGNHNPNHDQIISYDHDDHDFCQVGCSENVSVSSLKLVLESQDSTFEQKVHAIEKVRFLSEDLPRKNEGLIQMGFFSILLGLVFGAKITQEMMILVEKSLDCALKLLPFCCMRDLSKMLVEEEYKFENFKLLFQDGSFLVKICLCNLIEVIFTSSSSVPMENELLATKIANDTKLLQMLITSLHDYQQNPEVSEAGIKVILALSSSSSQESYRYRENLVKEGLIHSLVKYILEVEGKEKNLGGKGTKALELALELESAKEMLLVNEVKDGVKALNKMVFRVSGDDQGSESAVNCLMKLCCESEEVREAAICGGVLTQLLFLLQSQCSVRVKTRARMLLKLLRSMWIQDPNHV